MDKKSKSKLTPFLQKVEDCLHSLKKNAKADGGALVVIALDTDGNRTIHVGGAEGEFGALLTAITTLACEDKMFELFQLAAAQAQIEKTTGVPATRLMDVLKMIEA